LEIEVMNLQSEQINELAAALAKAQGEFGVARKSADNPFFKSKYADLAEVVAACRAQLSKHGLAVIQQVLRDEAGVFLRSTLAHGSGQWIASEYAVRPMRVVKDREGRATEVEANDPQSVGSAITYARRYSLAALVGVVTDDDDDGNAASGRGEDSPQLPQKRIAPRPAPKTLTAPEKSNAGQAGSVSDEAIPQAIRAITIQAGKFSGRPLHTLIDAECGEYYSEILESLTKRGVDPKTLTGNAKTVFDYVFTRKGMTQ
jgi:hypothetical protein